MEGLPIGPLLGAADPRAVFTNATETGPGAAGFETRWTITNLLRPNCQISMSWGGPGRSRTDRLRVANAVLSRTELQAHVASHWRRLFNFA